MNAMRLLAVAAMLCALTVAVRAEDKKADNAKLLVGAWEVVKADKGTVPVGSTVEFTKGGKMKVTYKADGKSSEGTYTVDGDKFKFKLKMGDSVAEQTITIKKISDKELSTTDEDGKAVELMRKK